MTLIRLPSRMATMPEARQREARTPSAPARSGDLRSERHGRQVPVILIAVAAIELGIAWLHVPELIWLNVLGVSVPTQRDNV